MSGAVVATRTLLTVVRHPGFARFLAGVLMMGTGTWLFNVTSIVLVFRLTESALFVGVVASSQFVSTVVFVAWTGRAADRWDRRQLLMVLQLVAAGIGLTVAILAALEALSAAVLIAASLVMGLVLAFSSPTLNALIPQLVDVRDLEVAIALNSLAFNLARALGPVLAAGLLSLGGAPWAYVAQAVMALLFLVALASLRARPVRLADDPGSFLASLRETWSDREVRWPLVIVAAVAVSVDPVTTLAPVYATEVFGVGDSATGFMVAAFGVGAVLSAFVVVPRLARHDWGHGAAVLATGAGVLGLALAPNLVFAVPWLLLAGVGFLGSATRSTGRLHQLVADHRIGRVMAMWSVAFFGTRPIAAIVDGAIADRWGPRIATAVLAVPALTIGVRTVVSSR